ADRIIPLACGLPEGAHWNRHSHCASDPYNNAKSNTAKSWRGLPTDSAAGNAVKDSTNYLQFQRVKSDRFDLRLDHGHVQELRWRWKGVAGGDQVGSATATIYWQNRAWRTISGRLETIQLVANAHADISVGQGVGDSVASASTPTKFLLNPLLFDI